MVVVAFQSGFASVRSFSVGKKKLARYKYNMPRLFAKLKFLGYQVVLEHEIVQVASPTSILTLHNLQS